MENFSLKQYVATISKQVNAEKSLETATGNARAAHVSFFESLTVKPLLLADIRNNALTSLQSFAGKTWPSEAGKGFVGYQKAAKSGCIAATAYNRFAAWTTTNVAEDGHLLTDAEKETNKTAKETARKQKEETENDAMIASAIKEATEGMISKENVVPLSLHACLDYIQGLTGVTTEQLKTGIAVVIPSELL